MSLADEIAIVQWVSKIILCSLIKETTLDDFTKKDPGKRERVLSLENLKQSKNISYLAQSIKTENKFIYGKPWSLFKLTFKDYSYNYLANAFNGIVCYQFGKTGFMLCLNDIGYMKKAFTTSLKYSDKDNYIKTKYLTSDDIAFYTSKLVAAREIRKRNLDFQIEYNANTTTFKSRRFLNYKLRIDKTF